MTRRLLPLLLLLFFALPVHAATLNRGNGAEPETLDPTFAGTQGEDNIIGDLMVGLTTLDARGQPVPGMAERWTVSKDGLTWTFTLRTARWSDGAFVTADDFDFAFRRLLNPKTGSRYAYNLWPIKNARAVNGGKMPETALGIAVPKPTTIILTLESPAPYLPELLAHISASPLPRHAIEKHGTAWARPGTHVSNGPYRLESWRPNDRVTLVRNPRFFDAAKVAIETVVYFPTTDADAALRRFRAGELDLQSPAPLAQLGWLRANLPGAFKVTPSLAASYLAINQQSSALKDVRVRRALNLAIDRETITQKVLKLGEPAAYGIVPPGTANYPGGVSFDFRKMPFPARLAQAQSLMREAGFGPANRLTLRYATTTSADNRRLAAVLQAMLSQIYVRLDIAATGVPIHFRNLRERQYDLGIANWYADFNDAANFLDLLRADAGNNYAGYRNPAFDALMTRATAQADTRARAALLAQAEAMALRDYPWIPLRFPAQTELVAATLRGWAANPRSLHRSRWLGTTRP
jgi:oligopeptide transport system substrate-binding protein